MQQIQNKRKIFNDPVYGFITIPTELAFDLIEHRYFQRLRRITQLGLTHYVYPGALHTRFHHALGAMHLTSQAVEVLRSKEIAISEQEAEAVICAVLLHDIGHAPFSHALEHTLLPLHHEHISVELMKKLNLEFEGKLTLAIAIFEDKYPKKFLHQLVSGQLDMDRMDYLNRDSYFTGVHEGVIGYDRLIKMLNVVDNELVIEEKGIFSVEKFLVARRLMYWQVYLHKTVVCAEQMLISTLKRAKYLAESGEKFAISPALQRLLELGTDFAKNVLENTDIIELFTELDDIDIIAALKVFAKHHDTVLQLLSKSIIERKLFKVELSSLPPSRERIDELRQEFATKLNLSEKDVKRLVIEATETNRTYHTGKDEIKIQYKSGEVLPMSQTVDYGLSSHLIAKYFLCYPKADFSN